LIYIIYIYICVCDVLNPNQIDSDYLTTSNSNRARSDPLSILSVSLP